MPQDFPTPAQYAAMIDKLRSSIVAAASVRPQVLSAKTLDELRSLSRGLIDFDKMRSSELQVQTALREARKLGK